MRSNGWNTIVLQVLIVYHGILLFSNYHICKADTECGNGYDIFSKPSDKMPDDLFSNLLEEFVKRNADQQPNSDVQPNFYGDRFSMQTDTVIDERYKAPPFLASMITDQRNRLKQRETIIYPASGLNRADNRLINDNLFTNYINSKVNSSNTSDAGKIDDASGASLLKQSVATLYSNQKMLPKLSQVEYGNPSFETITTDGANEDSDLLTPKPSLWNDAAQFLENISSFKSVADEDLLLSSSKNRNSGSSEHSFSVSDDFGTTNSDYLKNIFQLISTTTVSPSTLLLPPPIIPTVSSPNQSPFIGGTNFLPPPILFPSTTTTTNTNNNNNNNSPFGFPHYFSNDAFQLGVPLESLPGVNNIPILSKNIVSFNQNMLVDAPVNDQRTSASFGLSKEQQHLDNLNQNWRQSISLPISNQFSAKNLNYLNTVHLNGGNAESSKPVRYIHEQRYFKNREMNNNDRSSYYHKHIIPANVQHNDRKIPAREFDN